MVEVHINEGESFDSMLRRFSKRVQNEMVLAEARKRRFFEPPTTSRKKKAAIKKRKSAKLTSGKL